MQSSLFACCLQSISLSCLCSLQFISVQFQPLHSFFLAMAAADNTVPASPTARSRNTSDPAMGTLFRSFFSPPVLSVASQLLPSVNLLVW